LERAAKRLSSGEAVVINIDRDTRGVGGSPSIPETILQKIRNADVFVWDATLVGRFPKPTPNPNVLFELGYAFALMGDGRLVGVLNEAAGSGPKNLPFDLQQRRWPVLYRLSPLWRWIRKLPPLNFLFWRIRQLVRDRLVEDLEKALKAALSEPKSHALKPDSDLHAAKRLGDLVSSRWMSDWYEARSNYIQYEDSSVLDLFGDYWRLAEQPENVFKNEDMRQKHDALVAAIRKYIAVSATERVPDKVDSTKYVISTKAHGGFIKDFDSRYQGQIDRLSAAVNGVRDAWAKYVETLRELYPEVTSTFS